MKRLSKRLSWLAVAALAVIAAGSVLRAAPAPRNLALGRPYTLEPPPNYPLTLDPGDATQLTDGVYTRGFFWTQKTTVGWANRSPVFIRVDLGQDSPISGASFSTAAGTSGVNFPTHIWFLVSTDGQEWHRVGDLVAESNKETAAPPADHFNQHVYRTDRWRTHGRWAAFMVESKPFVFVDEVEVYSGDPSALNERLPGTGATGSEGFLVQNGVRSRLEADWTKLRRLVDASNLGADAKAAEDRKLTDLQGQLADSVKVASPASFKAVLPLNDWHTRLFAVQAEFWRSLGVPALKATVPASRYDPVPYLTGSPAGSGGTAASVTALRSERRSTAVNLVNAGPTAVEAAVRLEGLPGGARPAYVELRRVVWSDFGGDVGPLPAALEPLTETGDGYRLTLPSGMVTQLWVRVRGAAALPVGDHTGQIVVTTPSGGRASVRLRIHASPVAFPAGRALHLGGWDYTNLERAYGVTPGNHDSLVAVLKQYHVDIPWATLAAMPPGHYDAQGRATQLPSTDAFDRWVALWPGAAYYNVFVIAGDQFAGAKRGTPEFERRVSEWARFWSDHARVRGLKTGQLRILLVDEPHLAPSDQTFVDWASVIKKAAPDLVLWEDPTWADPRQMSLQFQQLADVFCPSWLRYDAGGTTAAAFFADLHRRGKTLGFYSNLAETRILDPYSYARLMAWACFEVGATEEHLWAFSDNGGSSSWNPYLRRSPTFTPLFLDPAGATPTKQMEAVRDGVQDYEALVLLRRAAQRRRQANAQDPLVAEADQLLQEEPGRVLGPPGQRANPRTNRTEADVATDRAIRLLERLEKRS